MKNPFAKKWALAVRGRFSEHVSNPLTFWRFRTEEEARAKAYELNLARDDGLTDFVAVKIGE